MSEREDLTRWNRASLSRFRYVDGNAAEYLDILRQQLVEKFADPDSNRCEWLTPAEKIPANEEATVNESLVQRQERLSRKRERILDMYHRDRSGLEWEITRTFARACHILTEYVNAYANEAYLGTATQWDHVRRLVEMLDYHPAPPASAITRLVFEAEDNKTGTVGTGFKVQHTPETGAPKIIFETLEDIVIDSDLNELRPKGWDRSDDPAVPPSDQSGSAQKPVRGELFSSIANKFVIDLQGVGKNWEAELNALKNDFRIKDFLDLDSEDSGTNISPIKLRELKAKATAICKFKLENGWSNIYDKLLPDILADDPTSTMEDSIAQLVKKSSDEIIDLQRKIALIGVYLDHPLFNETRLRDLIAGASPTDESNNATNNTEADGAGANRAEIITESTEENNKAYSVVANWPALYLQGIGNEWAFQLDASRADGLDLPDDKNSYTIKKLADIVPEESGSGINLTVLNELKAKATAICEFSLDEDWSELYDWLLPEITEANLLTLTGVFTRGSDLVLISIGDVSELSEQGRKTMIVAKIIDDYHVRIFDDNEVMTLDKGVGEFLPDEALTKALDDALGRVLGGQEIEPDVVRALIKMVSTNLSSDFIAAKQLQQKIELIGSFIDHALFVNSTLQDLLPSNDSPETDFKVSDSPVIHLQGISSKWAWQLYLADKNDNLPEDNSFKIKDFLTLELETEKIKIGETKLKEFIAIATAICDFELEEGWASITNWPLTRITSEDEEYLADFTGNSQDEVRLLQHRINLIGSYLDHPQYAKAKLKDLIQPPDKTKPDFEPDSVVTQWHATVKPKVKAEQVAMILRRPVNIAEAGTVDAVDEKTQAIHLLLDQVDYSWNKWPKGDATLQVSPRWKRDCWLNGSDVIRTKSAHGISAGSFIGWKLRGVWKYAKVTETDKKSLRLDYENILPQHNTKIYQLSPVTGPVVAKNYEVVSIQGPTKEDDITAPELEVEDVSPELKDVAASIFTVNIPNPPAGGFAPESAGGGGGLLPPASLPKIGSFLFPSPMLPMDLVKIAVELMLSMGVMMIPSTGEFVIKGLPPDMGGGDEMVNVNDLYSFLKDLKVPVYTNEGKDGDDNDVITKEEFDAINWKIDTDEKRIEALRKLITTPDGKTATPLFKKIRNNLDNYGPPLIVEQSPKVLAVVDDDQADYIFNGSADRLKKNDWVVGRFTDGLRALKIMTVSPNVDDDQTETFSLSFNNLIGNEGELQKVYADFRNSIVAEGASVNSTELDSADIDLEKVPDGLSVGKNVLLTGGGKTPIAATIASIDGNTIKTNPSAEGFSKGELQILANVVLAGHGESKPEKILGSGDAARSNQEFILEVEKVSFTPDATMSSGVAAAIEVEVGGRVWEQVSTLKDSVPGDHHYAVRMTEEGWVKILFGDGDYGRRLPSGKNNVRVRYRVGTGLVGNVPEKGLEKPLNPSPLVKAIYQPFRAAGGGEMEDLSSLRENAPPTLLALERAVSLSDFSHLAASQSSIWQAKAYSQILHGGRTESVRVVIVPTDGIESKDINDAIQTFLQNHALPGVQVFVDPFTPARFDMTVTVRVKTDEFVAEKVENTVTSALIDHFTLENRKLGEHLYLSEVYKIVEGVKGVENSICEIFEHPPPEEDGSSEEDRSSDEDESSEEDEAIEKKASQVIEAGNESTVIYLDTKADETPSKLIVTHEEYEP